MTDSTTCPVPPPPYTSKDNFLAHGLDATTLRRSLNCSICREPLLTSTTTTDTSAICRVGHSQPQVSVHHTGTSPSLEELVPEAPVRIRHCRHIFGHTCLTTWFNSSLRPNTCPECNIILFSASHIHLALRRPTRARRSQFADFIEHVLQDAEGAEEIREDLMSERTTFMMRELTLEMWRQQGWEVTWEYGGEEEVERDEVEEQSEDFEAGQDVEIADEDLESEKGDAEGQTSQDSE